MDRLSVKGMAIRARSASKYLAGAGQEAKNRVLELMAESLLERANDVLEANGRDVEKATLAGLPSAMLKRLTVTQAKLESMANGIRKVAALPDPVGKVLESWERPNGLKIQKVSVPFGVIGIIYESRPDVTADATALCLKSGNAVILRGGTESIESNLAIVGALGAALAKAGAPVDCVQYLVDPDRSAVKEMLHLSDYIDLLIPRGGANLIKTVVQDSTVPVIETGTGNCHVYVHEKADLSMALDIAINAKCSNPAVCNAMETLLVDRAVARDFLPGLVSSLKERGVEVRGCSETRAIVPDVQPATEDDWATEYLDLTLAVKVVGGLDEALDHISKHGTMHSEAIVTTDEAAAARFRSSVDAACVYVNASTRFTDGFEFGFGAEIGISTQKLHARGPMGLRELNTYKYVVTGNGQIR